jgi:hypothetical protein
MDNSPGAVNHGVVTVSVMMRAANGTAGRLAHCITYLIDAARLSCFGCRSGTGEPEIRDLFRSPS